MNGTNLLKIALRALANNKLRAFLTMLGIIIGVASVITMLAIGQGSKKSIQQQISEMGSNMIMIHPGADMRGGVRQDPSAMQTLKLADYEALRDETSFLSAISPNVSSSGQLIAGNNNYPASVNGVGTEYLDIRQLTVENGDMFTEADIQSSAKVCVIGKTIVDNLFPDGSDPVGKIIRFNKIPPCSRSAQSKRVQLYGTRPRCRSACTIYHRNETSACRYVFAGSICLCPHRGYDGLCN
jgi:putative ABC transport system permease protein